VGATDDGPSILGGGIMAILAADCKLYG
jgi:hypothetical protein